MDPSQDKDEKDNAFPPEYAHVGKMVLEAEERIRQIDEQIKNVPNDKGPEPQYKPPGFLRSRQPGSRDQFINSLEKQKDQIKTDIMEKVDKETIKADPKIATAVRDTARERFYPNPYKEIDATQKQAHKSQERDMEKSQDLMASYTSGNQVSKPEKEEPKQSDTQPAKEEQKPFSMTGRFTQSLSYPIESEKNDKAPDQSPDRQKDKDDLDKG